MILLAEARQNLVLRSIDAGRTDHAVGLVEETVRDYRACFLGPEADLAHARQDLRELAQRLRDGGLAEQAAKAQDAADAPD